MVDPRCGESLNKQWDLRSDACDKSPIGLSNINHEYGVIHRDTSRDWRVVR